MDNDKLADIAKSHNNDSSALQTTIASSGGANFHLVPGPKGTVKFLHHGFSTTTHLGGGAPSYKSNISRNMKVERDLFGFGAV